MYIYIALGIPDPAITRSRIIREKDDGQRQAMPVDYQQWLATLPELEQEQDETVAFLLQGTGRM